MAISCAEQLAWAGFAFIGSHLHASTEIQVASAAQETTAIVFLKIRTVQEFETGGSLATSGTPPHQLADALSQPLPQETEFICVTLRCPIAARPGCCFVPEHTLLPCRHSLF